MILSLYAPFVVPLFVILPQRRAQQKSICLSAGVGLVIDAVCRTILVVSHRMEHTQEQMAFSLTFSVIMFVAGSALCYDASKKGDTESGKEATGSPC
jgi:hypothetical protein